MALEPVQTRSTHTVTAPVGAAEQQNGLCCFVWPEQLRDNSEYKALVHVRSIRQREKHSCSLDRTITQIRGYLSNEISDFCLLLLMDKTRFVR